MAESRRSLLRVFSHLNVRYWEKRSLSVAFVLVPFVQLGGDLLHCLDHVRDTPLSVAVNGLGAFKRDHIAMPVGAFSAWRRPRSPDRYDFVDLFHHSILGEQNGENWNGQTASQRGGKVHLFASRPARSK